MLAVLAVILLAGLFGVYRLRGLALKDAPDPPDDPPGPPAVSPTAPPQDHALERALIRVSELEAKITAQYPDFHAVIFEIINQDPVFGPDLFAALVVQVLNNGHKSSCKGWSVTAQTPYGAIIPVDIFGNGFQLIVNNGRDCFDFQQSDYITYRTDPEPVGRGKPITGILPCVFRGITNAKEVDVRTLKVEFSDVIGDADGNRKAWSANPIAGMKWEDPIPKKHRPTLPELQQPCGSQGPTRTAPADLDAEKRRDITPLIEDYKRLGKLMVDLETLAFKYDQTKPVETGPGMTREQIIWLQMITTDFEPLKREIVKSLSKIEDRHGIERRGANEWLAIETVGPGTLRNLSGELLKIMTTIRDMIADRALDL